MIYLFDCSVHPTINSDWLATKYNGLADFDLLINDMKKNGIKKAFAVGMKNIGEYDEDLYIKKVNQYKDFLYPIAYFDDFDKNQEEIFKRLSEIKNKGYYGIKIHPRFSHINFANENLPEVIKEANKKNLIVMLCTYFSSQELNVRDNLREISMLMNKIPDAKVIFLHSGVVNLLEFVNMMKIYKNTLFDLSYTLCKYKGSSLDNDIKFLFENFDRRICIGSDHPEVTLKELRERFEYFSENISKEKAENIAYKTLESYIRECGGVK